MAVSEAPWQLEFEKVDQRCGYLLTSGLWSDCSFLVGSETNQAVVPAHKLILAMSSPVFEAMFYGGLSDPNEPKIPIPDVKPETFRALLQYIYTGVINIDSFDNAWDLWYGAKKYMLPHLVKECNSYIYSVVGPMNVCRAYELACYFDEQTLMDKCIKIICTNTKEVLNDSSFVDIELDTLITVLSLEHLNVDSELDLICAVDRYAKAEQQRQITVDCEPLSEKLSELRLEPSTSEEKVLFNGENSSQRSPAVEVDSKTYTQVVTSKPTNKEVPEKLTIRAAIGKVRLLSLSTAQFLEGPARSDLLTEDESFAVLVNIISRDSAVPMPTGFSECRERRQPRSEAVDEGPIAEPRPKPSTESRGADTKLTTPAEVVRGLSCSRETLVEAARAARHLTCAADGTPESLALLVAAGGIPPLVAALDHPRTAVQYDAAWALTNIACDSENTKTLIDGGAIPKLVSLLGRGGAVAEMAAWALGNIAGAGDTASDAVMDAGALPALLAHMQPGAPSAPLATYVRTYRLICQKRMSSFWLRSRFELVSPAVPYIEKLLVLEDEQVLAESCWVLYHLADGAHLNPQIFAPSLALRLTALLTATPRVSTAALGAVGTMLGTTELIDRYLGAGCLDHIINFLKCGNPSYVEHAARAAGNILRTRLHIQLALNKGLLDALTLVLYHSDSTCKRDAARAITNLCIFGASPQLHSLAASAALQPYAALLSAGRRACYTVLRGLTNLLRKVEHNKLVLLLKLREIGLPQRLMTVQQRGGQSGLGNEMEESFKKLEQEGKNSVDNLVKWIKDSKIINETKAAEDKTRQLFIEVEDQTKVELEKFKEILAKLAEEQDKCVEDFAKMLDVEGPKFLKALSAALEAGVSAAIEAFEKERKKQ